MSARKPLSQAEIEILQQLCECEPGKGLRVPDHSKRIVNSLVRKGLAWTLESIFRVAIATDEGRSVAAALTGAKP